MADIKIAAIMRAGAFSPNHIGNDAAILNATVEQLRKRGCEVKVYSEEQFNRDEVTAPVIINMCREVRSVDRLQRLESEGCLVINSGYGIENCIRERMTRILIGSGVPYPESMLVDTDEVVKTRLTRGGFQRCWIKRGDSHKLHKEDVSYVRQPDEAQEVLQEYFLRGIRRAVINKHVAGDLVKFYGVAGSPFFYWYYPFDSVSNRRVAGSAPEAEAPARTFDLDRLKEVCARAADALNIMVYGGDAMVTPEGEIVLVDFNDWPSFAPCRHEAAVSIAKAVINCVKQQRRKQK